MAEIRTIGYIGMGIMGRAMAGNLLKAGFEVSVWNRTLSKCQPLIEQGATQAASPQVMAEGCDGVGPDVICINVSDTPDVEEVIFGEQGLIHGARPGLIVIDNSTISPVATQEMATKLAEKSVTLIDAPVSGGDVGAQNGTLSVMAGGDADAFARCAKVFEAVGKNITHLGPAGMGQVCKACNQIAVSCNLLGVCEAMALAKKSGLDLHKMLKVVSGGAAGSWQLANLGPRIAKGDYAPGFMIDLVLKDLAIVADAAGKLGLPLNGTSLAESYFRAVKDGTGEAEHDDGGKFGTQAMAKRLEQLGGFKF